MVKQVKVQRVQSESNDQQPTTLRRHRRPKGESKINIRKIKILIEKPLFYHQHRIALINANFIEYHKDSKKEIYKYIGEKIIGTIQYQPLKELFADQSDQRKKDLFSMIETALTLKNTQTRSSWEQIYFYVVKRILETIPENVNKKSRMIKWSTSLKSELQQPEFSKLLKMIKTKMPTKSQLTKLIGKQTCCMLARYCHFKENVCEQIYSQ